MRLRPRNLPASGGSLQLKPNQMPATKTKTKTRAKPKTIDAYLAALSEDKRAALQRLRKLIAACAPDAEECMSYQLPAFRLDGKVLVWFGAGANHCALYPGAVLDAFEAELQRYDTSKGTVRFQPSSPLPANLVRKLVKARIAKNSAKPVRATDRSARRR